MGKKKEHQNRLIQMAKDIVTLGEAISQMEKHMQSTWTDEVERSDLENLKERMKEVESNLCKLREEIGHLEKIHCKGI